MYEHQSSEKWSSKPNRFHGIKLYLLINLNSKIYDKFVPNNIFKGIKLSNIITH